MAEMVEVDNPHAVVEDALEKWEPVLRKEGERRISERIRKIALEGCSEEIQAFAACANGRMFAVAWKCRPESRHANACMDRFKKDEQLRAELRRKHAKEFPRAIASWEPKTAPNEAT